MPRSLLHVVLVAAACAAATARAQVAPSATERAAYSGLFAAADAGKVDEIVNLASAGARLDARDGHGRTPLIVAAFARQRDAMRALVAAGADANAMDADHYDIARSPPSLTTSRR